MLVANLVFFGLEVVEKWSELLTGALVASSSQNSLTGTGVASSSQNSMTGGCGSCGSDPTTTTGGETKGILGSDKPVRRRG